MTLGTPSYIPPEQIENAKNVDKRVDIYSLGGDAVQNADRERKNELMRTEEVQVDFKENRGERSENSFFLESQKLYLEPGKYRPKVSTWKGRCTGNPFSCTPGTFKSGCSRAWMGSSSPSVSLEVLRTRLGRLHPSHPLGSAITVIGGSRSADLTIVGNPGVKEEHATILYDARKKTYTLVASVHMGDLTPGLTLPKTNSIP